MTEQPDFLEQLSCSSKHEIAFTEWYKTRGAKWILNRCVRWAWVFKRDYPYRRIGFRAVWAFVRSDIIAYHAKCKARGIDLDPQQGYALNNNYCPYMTRKVMEKEPRLEGYFKTREVGEQRRKVVVIVNPEERVA